MSNRNLLLRWRQRRSASFSGSPLFGGHCQHSRQGCQSHLFTRAAPFGYGLSYTSFKYDHLTISPQSGNLNAPVSVIFDVTNAGSREGAEVAEVYVGNPHASVPRPVKELKGFARVNLKPGQTQRVMLTLDRRAFSYYDVQGKDWKADPGEFTTASVFRYDPAYS